MSLKLEIRIFEEGKTAMVGVRIGWRFDLDFFMEVLAIIAGTQNFVMVIFYSLSL